MKLIDKAIAAKTAKHQREHERGRNLGKRWMTSTDNDAAVARLQQWHGSPPTDIEELCEIAVGYHDPSISLQFLNEALGVEPACCRKACIAGFYQHVHEYLNN